MQEYYDIIKLDACVPIGHAVNANMAMVTGFSVHDDAEEAKRRGGTGAETAHGPHLRSGYSSRVPLWLQPHSKGLGRDGKRHPSRCGGYYGPLRAPLADKLPQTVGDGD